jgi:hypothetical protein
VRRNQSRKRCWRLITVGGGWHLRRCQPGAFPLKLSSTRCANESAQRVRASHRPTAHEAGRIAAPSVPERLRSHESSTLRHARRRRVASAHTREPGRLRRAADSTRCRSAHREGHWGGSQLEAAGWRAVAVARGSGCKRGPPKARPVTGPRAPRAQEPAPPDCVLVACSFLSLSCTTLVSLTEPCVGSARTRCAAPRGCVSPRSQHSLRCARGAAASRRCWHAQVRILAQRSTWHSSGCPAPG